MIPMNPTERSQLKFDVKGGVLSQKFRVSANKIGWIHALADQPGASYDIKIKDALGRLRLERHCGNETTTFGELVNLDTLIGEEVEVVLENPKNLETLHLALN